jgi:hypothetical protein
MKKPLKSSPSEKDLRVTTTSSPGWTMLLLSVNECRETSLYISAARNVLNMATKTLKK